MKFFKSDFTGNLINLNKYHFLINAFLINLILLYKRMKRTPAIVKKIYDKERSLIKIDNILDKKKDFILINDEIIFNSRLKIRRIISKKIQKHISKDQYDLIIEVGSGTGINLFNLCKNNIKKKFLGIELSKKSVDLCNLINIELKKKNIDFINANIINSVNFEDYKQYKKKLIFTSFALEQIPNLQHLYRAIRNIFNLNPYKIIFLEPDPSLWNWSFRNITARIRSYRMNRLPFLLPLIKNYLKKNNNYKIIKAKRCKVGFNPHCEMTEIILELK
jgi:SAM-dependent methyltransferase